MSCKKIRYLFLHNTQRLKETEINKNKQANKRLTFVEVFPKKGKKCEVSHRFLYTFTYA